jgi:membrane protein implicated in regulation of membrane protease activity
MGNGQYILVRRDAYERLGGRESIRGQTMDMMLAMRFKEAGLRVALAFGPGMAETRSPGSFLGIWHAWTRILAGALRHSLPMLAGAVLLLLFVDAMSYAIFAGVCVALALGGGGTLLWTLFILSVVTVAVSLLSSARFYRVLQNDPRFVVFRPAASLIVAGMVIAGIWGIVSGRGFMWKGRRCATRLGAGEQGPGT